MVYTTPVRYVLMSTFGQRVKGKMFNHRKPLKFRKFQQNIDPEEIVAYHSQDNVDEIEANKVERTFGDARKSLGRDIPILPDLPSHILQANNLFQAEKDRQKSLIARIEKIKVSIDTKPYVGKELMMDRYIDTPYDCARHLHEFLTTRSVVAEVQEDLGDQNTEEQAPSMYWDMHRPLEKPCKLKLRHFTEDNVSEVNKIYWRSCCFTLGMAVRLAFKDHVKALVHSWPKPDVKSGSFVYDVALNFNDIWKPSEDELRNFTKILWRIKDAALPFEYLKVSEDKAREMFSDNPFKLEAIESILKDESSGGKVTVYRCGGLLDISRGPMISNTNIIGRISLASVHNLEMKSASKSKVFYRFQGVSLPNQLPVSSFLYQNLILDKARSLNRTSL